MAPTHQNASAAASTSSAQSASTTYRHYDVFINHRGPDVKKTLASHLHQKLGACGLQVFLDEREMEVGHEIPSQIEAAIQVASVHIAIFSPRYAESKWCLNELLSMVKSGATIIPVFYNIEPYDLEHGAYVKILNKQEEENKQKEEKKRSDPQTFQNWRDALRRFAKQSGFVLKAGGEVELLDKVVQSVEENVRKTQLDVAKHPTGLDGKFKDFERKLLSRQQESTEARVVGIIGSGGIGKTTLAKYFYNNKRLEYSGSSFLFDVREKDSVKSLNILQSKIIYDLRHRNVKIDSSDEGIDILKNNLSDFHALIILDDVDKVNQLDAFLPIKRVLDPRSLILVTSRNKHVLECAEIAETSIYQLRGLDTCHSEELFCLHAFFHRQPLPGFEYLVEGFLRVCDGMPLSLKVLGALLCKQDISYWEHLLNGLHQLPKEIENRLQISYESLNDPEKQIFLDIACFSVGKDKDTWIRIWGESGWNGVVGFQNLISKCLVEVDGENKIRMHDHLVDLGRSIASISMPRRLWAATVRDVYDLLEQSSAVRGIRMAPLSSCGDTSDEGLLCPKSKIPLNKSSSQYGLSGIKQLRLLEAEGDFVESILTWVQLPNLIWLSWNHCPCISLPSCIPTHGLKVLEVAGRALKKLWQSNSHRAPLQLQELYIDAPFSEFPKPMGQLKNLEKLVVEYSMDEGTHLATLPEELRYLCCLKYLKLKRCSKLQTIPESLGNLTNLQHLNLSGCKGLERLPDCFGVLTNLQHLDLSECGSLRKLPDSLENLSSLQHINLSKCESLGMLPDCLENLTKLQHFDLSKCESLGMLPISVGNLTNLQHIDLSGCKSLESLPDSFVDLTKLKHMDLSQCEFLEMLPESFRNLINVQHIDMSGCNSLKRLPDSWENLTNLQHIDLSGCRSLEGLPDSVGNLTNLHHINLCMCESLKKLPIFNRNLTNIEDINLYGCVNLETLPESIENLTNLQHIDLSGCASLESLPDSFVKLTNLQHIDFRGGSHLKMIPGSFGELTKLRHIDFQCCLNLKMLPDSFGNLTNLQHLDLQGCSSLEKLPDSFGNLTNLKRVNLSSCVSLKMIPNSFGNLQQLKYLDLTDCCSLTISSEPLTTVAELYLGRNLTQLPNDVVCISKLELLQLEGPLLEGLPPSLGHLTSLKKLFLVECTELQCLPNSVGLLTQLKVLEITDCGIQNLPPELLKLNNLELLEVRNCPLSQLPFNNVKGERETILLTEEQRVSLEQTASSDKGLRKLKVLHLDLIEISELSFPQGVCPSLQDLRISDCKKIVEVGALPRTLRSLDLRWCGALRKIGGLCDVLNLIKLDMRGCDNIKLEDLPGLEALTVSLKVFRAPLDPHDGLEGDTRGLETLTSILRARRRWCNCCTEGVLPFFKAV